MHYLNIVWKSPFLLRTVLLTYLTAYHNFQKNTAQFSTATQFTVYPEATLSTDTGPLPPPVTNNRHLKIEVLLQDIYSTNLLNQNL